MPVPPATLAQLLRRLQEVRPDIPFEDPSRPVVLVLGAGTEHRRALACDADVHRLFEELHPEGTLELQVIDLFPDNGAQRDCRTIVLPVSSLIQPLPQRPPGSCPPRGGTRPAFRRHKDVAGTPVSPPSPPDLGRPPPRPRPQGEPLRETQLGPEVECEVEAVPQPELQEPQAQRPATAPPRGTAPSLAATAPPGSLAGAVSPGAATGVNVPEWGPPGPMSGALQSDTLDIARLRGKYEHLWFDSGKKRAALDWLLRARSTVPGPNSLHVREMEDIRARAAQRKPGRAGSREQKGKGKAFVEVGRWDEGEYCTVKDADVPLLQRAMESFAQIEGVANARLEDGEVSSTTWSIGGARRRLAQDLLVHATRPQYLPRRILVESPWMQFEGMCLVSFRLYPCGDGSAKPGDSTVYIWTSHPPGFSFTWNLRIGGCMDTVPRLWQATTTRSRIDVLWSKLEVALVKLRPTEDHIDIKFRVLQWHGPEDDPREWLPEHHTSSSLALQVLQWTGAAGT